jgi:hypothetical protein
MVESKSAEWKRIYQEALQETDQEKLIAKICAADAFSHAGSI